MPKLLDLMKNGYYQVLEKNSKGLWDCTSEVPIDASNLEMIANSQRIKSVGVRCETELHAVLEGHQQLYNLAYSYAERSKADFVALKQSNGNVHTPIVFRIDKNYWIVEERIVLLRKVAN